MLLILIMNIQETWNLANTPKVPHFADSNLEESDDEDEVHPSHDTTPQQSLDEILEEVRILMEEDDEARRQWQLRQEEDE